jgi:TPR repeat protein
MGYGPQINHDEIKRQISASKKDSHEALTWYRCAAEQGGDVDAKVTLGLAYQPLDETEK